MRFQVQTYNRLKNYFAYSGGTYAGMFVLGEKAYITIIHSQSLQSYELNLPDTDPYSIASQFSALLEEKNIRIDCLGFNMPAQYFPIRIPRIPLDEIDEFLSSNPDLFLPPGVSPEEFVWRYIPYAEENDELLLTILLISRNTIQTVLKAFQQFHINVTLLTADLFEWPCEKDAVLVSRNEDSSVYQFYKNGIPVYSLSFSENKTDFSLLSVSFKQFGLESVEPEKISDPFRIATVFARLSGPASEEVLVNFLSPSELSAAFLPVKKRQTTRLGLIVGLILFSLLLIGRTADYILASKIERIKNQTEKILPIITKIRSDEKRLQALMETYRKFSQSELNKPAISNLIAFLANHVPPDIRFRKFSFQTQKENITIRIIGIAGNPEIISEYMQRIESNSKDLRIRLKYTRYLNPSIVLRKWKKSSSGLYEFQLEMVLHAAFS